MAINEAKRGIDADAYIAVTDLLHSISPDDPLGVPDTTWATEIFKSNRSAQDTLETQLKGYKNNLIKESIRVRSSTTSLAVRSCFGGLAFNSVKRLTQILTIHRWATKI
jgi:COP9 signalosome complex subunit 1